MMPYKLCKVHDHHLPARQGNETIISIRTIVCREIFPYLTHYLLTCPYAYGILRTWDEGMDVVRNEDINGT